MSHRDSLLVNKTNRTESPVRTNFLESITLKIHAERLLSLVRKGRPYGTNISPLYTYYHMDAPMELNTTLIDPIAY